MTQPNRTKILIAERDCASLVSLMLWLDQFPEFEVTGATSEPASVLAKVAATQPDAVILGGAASLAEEIYMAKALGAFSNAPAVVVRAASESAANESHHDVDALVGPATSIKDLFETIRRAVNKKRVAISAAYMPATKAG